MGALMRAFDWSSTTLGPAQAWPQPLRTAIRFLLNSGHPMYVWWGPELLCFYNDAYRQSIGPERHPCSLGQPGRQVWEEIWDIIGPQIDQVMSGGPPTWHENALVPITRGGRREDVYWTYSYGPIDDETAPSGVGGVLVQCTETTRFVLADRRRAEEIERQRRLFEQAPGFVIIMRGADHIVDFVNDAHRRVFGSDDWLGKPIRAAFPSLEGQGYFEELDKVYASGVTYEARRARVNYQRVAGGPLEERVLNFIYAPIYDDSGLVCGIFCDGYDVTEARADAAALERSEEQLRLAVEAAEVGFWDVDVVNDRLFWPPRVKAMFGISADVEVSMADFYAGLHPADREATTLAFAAAADPLKRDVYDVEYRTVGKEDGVVRWVAAKGRAVFEDGRCVRVIGTAIDITQRKRAEELLRELNETLETRVSERTAELNAAHDQLRQSQKLEAMGSLTGGVAHDFNNLLMPIFATFEMLQRKGLGQEREQRAIAGAMQSAERAKTLVQRLLAFARRQPLQSVAVDLNQLIRNMADLVASTTGPQIKVVVEVADSLPAAKADPNQLEMALLNLSVNARDAMPEGGTLRISATREVISGEGRVGLSPGSYLCLSVADTGVGMDEATLARAVEPFFSTKGIGKGTGLGLSMVHGLASQLGGELRIKSRPGLGTNVELWLPQTEDVPEAPSSLRELDMARGQGAALLVDDEEFVRLSTGDMLTDLGYRVIEAASAEEALRMTRDGLRVDFVITDHLMSGMTGVDLARAVREHHPGLPVLIVSGYAETDGIAADLPRLTKPFLRADLASAIADLTSSTPSSRVI